MTAIAVGDKIERAVAKVCLWSLALAILASLLPEKMFTNDFVVGGITLIAAVLLISWIYLMVAHLRRIIFYGTSRYTVGQILAVLFIPVLGAIAVSIKWLRDKHQ